MMQQFLVVHGYGYPQLFVKLTEGFKGVKAGEYAFIKMLEGEYK